MKRLPSPGIIGIAALLWLGGQVVWAWPEPRTEEEGARARLDAPEVGKRKPNVELPPQVPAPAGKLTLFADFAAAQRNAVAAAALAQRRKVPPGSQEIVPSDTDVRGDQVPLYLVNRTAAAVELSGLSLGLEYQSAKDGWVRTQPIYGSWCGTRFSYLLPPGQYVVYLGYMERDGTRAKVRFASTEDGDLASNEGEGWYSPSDARLAQVDDLAYRLPQPLADLLDPFERGDGPTLLEAPGQHVAAMRLTQALGGTAYYKKVALNLAKSLEEKPGASAEDKSAAEALRKIAEERWPARRDPAALRERCRRALAHPEQAGKTVGAPESFPALDWAVLEDLAHECKPEEVPKWKPVVDLLLKAEDPGTSFGVLGHAPIADEYVPDDFFSKNLLKDNAASRLICAQVLLRRGHREWLVDDGPKLSPSGQIEILSVLAAPASDGERLERPSEREVAFALHCLKTQPLEAAAVLASAHLLPILSDEMYTVLRDFLQSQADQSARASEDFKQDTMTIYKLSRAVDLLSRIGTSDDEALLRKLLEYRGYGGDEMTAADAKGKTETTVYQTYEVRKAAKEALLKMKIPVSEDLVLEKRFSKPGP